MTTLSPRKALKKNLTFSTNEGIMFGEKGGGHLYLSGIKHVKKEEKEEIIFSGSGHVHSGVHSAIVATHFDSLFKTISPLLVQWSRENEMPTPVIAGGAIRDQFFGIRPKDIDIFIDAANKEEDEIHDLCCSLLNLLCTNVRGFAKTCPKYLGREGDVSYGGEEGRESFIVYEAGHDEFPRLDPVDDVLDFKIQVIAWPDIKEGTEALLKSFDYSMVRAAFHPDEGYIYSEDFVNAVKHKQIATSEELTSSKTINRVTKLMYRLENTKIAKQKWKVGGLIWNPQC